MTQKTITAVIDEFSDAVARLAEHAPPDVVEQLHKATGDLLEAFSTAATNLAAHEVAALQQQITALNKRTERRHVDAGDEQRRVDD